MDVGDGFGGSFSNVGEGEYEALIVVDLDLFWIVVMMVRSCSFIVQDCSNRKTER